MIGSSVISYTEFLNRKWKLRRYNETFFHAQPYACLRIWKAKCKIMAFMKYDTLIPIIHSTKDWFKSDIWIAYNNEKEHNRFRFIL